MTLLEITMVLGLGLAIVTSAMTQGFQQLQTLRHFRDVEYYSKDVPKVATAINNACRGADSFFIFQPTSVFLATLAKPGGSLAGGQARGGVLRITAKEKDRNGVEKERRTTIWAYPATQDFGGKWDEIGDGRAIDGTGYIHMSGNKFNLAMKTAYGPFSLGSNTGSGWVLVRNIAGVEFDIIPGTSGSVLMTVWRQEEPGQLPKVAFELVLERK